MVIDLHLSLLLSFEDTNELDAQLFGITPLTNWMSISVIPQNALRTISSIPSAQFNSSLPLFNLFFSLTSIRHFILLPTFTNNGIAVHITQTAGLGLGQHSALGKAKQRNSMHMHIWNYNRVSLSQSQVALHPIQLNSMIIISHFTTSLIKNRSISQIFDHLLRGRSWAR